MKIYLYMAYIYLLGFSLITASAGPKDYYFGERKVNIFYEDFSSNKNRWFEGDTENQYTIVSNGFYTIKSKKAPRVMTKFIPFDYSVNYEISAGIEYVEGPNRKWGNYLEVGRKDGNNNLFFGFKQDSVKIGYSYNGETEYILNYTYLESLKGTSRADLKLRKYNGKMYFFVNEQLAAVSKEYKLTGYRFGFHCTTKNTIKVWNFSIDVFAPEMQMKEIWSITESFSNAYFVDDYVKKLKGYYTGGNKNLNKVQILEKGNPEYSEDMEFIEQGNYFVNDEGLNLVSTVNSFVDWDPSFTIHKNSKLFYIPDTKSVDIDQSYTVEIDFEIEAENQFEAFFRFNSNIFYGNEISLVKFPDQAQFALHFNFKSKWSDYKGIKSKLLYDYTYSKSYQDGRNKLVIRYDKNSNNIGVYLNNNILVEFEREKWKKYAYDEYEAGGYFKFFTNGIGKLKIFSFKVYHG